MYVHSSQFQDLCSKKSSTETLQNLPYFWNKKTLIIGFFSFCYCVCPSLSWHSPGHPLLQIQSCWKGKKPKNIWLFLFQKYGKFWSVSRDNFIKHKPLISDITVTNPKLFEIKKYYFRFSYSKNMANFEVFL